MPTRDTPAAPPRSPAWKWWITVVLLLATAINYMDRMTLASASVRITREMGLSDLQYGNLELAFGWAFAVGAVGFGFLADRVSVRLLYPAVVGLWSLAGIAAGLTHGYSAFLACRILLGLFEAGHWPCSLKTTFALLDGRRRAMGNSILQSGASLGAVITPQVMKLAMGIPGGSWRLGFIAVGAMGLAWVVLWLLLLRPGDLEGGARTAPDGARAGLRALLASPRFRAIAVLVVGIQVPWHIWRVWMMKFLVVGRGYAEARALDFSSVYYLCADVGCFGAGFLSLWLARRPGATPHSAQRRVYAGACALTSLGILVPWVPHGPLLLGLLLLVGAGSLALFPCYYTFLQEISPVYLGRLSGLLSLWTWAVTSPLQSGFGWLAQRLHTYDTGLCLAGLAPWAGIVAMRWWWQAPEGIGSPRPGADLGQ